MSDYFSGVTFPWQKVTPSDDAIVRRKMLADGIMTGCELSYSGSTLTMAAGMMIACGRQFRHTAAQNWAIVDATSGYARLLLTIDTTRASTKDSFDQIVDSIEYADSLAGFAALQQGDINQSGTVYQIVACVVSLGTGGITGIVSQLDAARIDAATKTELDALKKTVEVVNKTATAALPKAGGTLTGMLILTEGVHYGDTLPAAGNKGRIFFKKV